MYLDKWQKQCTNWTHKAQTKRWLPKNCQILRADFVLQRYPNCFVSSSGDVHLLYCRLCRLFPFPRICRIIFAVLFRRLRRQNFGFYALHCNRHERRVFYFYRRHFRWSSVYKTILFRKESIILCSNVSLAAERSVNTRINPSSTAALCPLRSDRTRLWLPA